MAGSGRARRFRQARQLKQGGTEQICGFCQANVTLGEPHDAECEYVEAEKDPWAVEAADDEEEDEEAW